MNKKILIPIIIILILVTGIGAYFIFQKPPVPKPPISRCGNGICEKGESVQCPRCVYDPINPCKVRCTEGTCPGDCKTPVNATKTCSELNGDICSFSQACSGDWLTTSDNEKCCSEECKDSSIIPPPSPPPSTGQISPFGIMAAFAPSTLTTISATDKVAWAGEKFRDLGAKWSRNVGELTIWGIIEPEFGKGYDWSGSDEVLKKAYEIGGVSFNMVVVIVPQRGKGENPDIPSDKENYYSKFVEALVERYDGDGINDYSPIIKVKYWQMTNEPFPRQWESAGGTIDGYVRFAELTHNAIKKSDPNAKIILGTFQLEKTEEINKLKQVIPKMKNKNLFDYVDTHYWNSGNNYKIPVGEARSVLDSNGYSNAKMVALESGTWAEMRGRGTEKDQANYLIKEYAYNIAHDFLLINWNNLVEWESFGRDTRNIYNYMGLIADGENNDTIPAGTPRLSYYTYKKMVEILEGSDWNNIQTIQESDGIYIYKFLKNGKPIWVAWNDNSGSQSITISGISSTQVKITEVIPKYESGKDVMDYNTAFNSYNQVSKDGKISLVLDDVPMFVEEN